MTVDNVQVIVQFFSKKRGPTLQRDEHGRIVSGETA